MSSKVNYKESEYYELIEEITDPTLYEARALHLDIAKKFPDSLLAYVYVDERNIRVAARIDNAILTSREMTDALISDLHVFAVRHNPDCVSTRIASTEEGPYGYSC